ncbi:MAG: hypothetical protein ACTIDE_16295 [Carnobacterium maltaromaticum]
MFLKYLRSNEKEKQKVVKIENKNSFEFINGIWKKSDGNYGSYTELSNEKAFELITVGTFSSAWYDGRIYDDSSFFQDNKYKKFMFILDANFAIMIREYQNDQAAFEQHYGKQKDKFLNTVNIIKEYKFRIIYTYACEEASRNKANGTINSEKYELMVKCIEDLFCIDVNYKIISKSGKVYGDISKSKIPILKDNGLFRDKSIITYIVVLKAYLLKYNTEISNNKEKVKAFLDFQENELQVFSPIALTFGIHYFGNDTGVLKGIKRGKGIEHILDKLYAAAIDLTLPTIASQLSEKTGYEEIPIFVTFDKGIKLIFDSLLIDTEGRTPSGNIVPCYTQKIFYSSGWKDDEIYELCKYGQNLQKNSKRKSKPRFQKLYQLGKKLEKELELLLDSKD